MNDVPERLEGSAARVARAYQHIDALDRLLTEFIDRRPYALRTHENRDRGEVAVDFVLRSEPPLICSVVIGEAVYNLRSALDYLVQALVTVNGGRPHRQARFPIVTTANSFRSERSKLAGMRDDAITMIERLQPYDTRQHSEGVDALWLLSELSNIDKHRLLHLTRYIVSRLHYSIPSDVAVVSVDQAGPGSALKDGTNLLTARVSRLPSDRAQVNVDLDITFDVAFDEETTGAEIAARTGRNISLGQYGVVRTLLGVHGYLSGEVFPMFYTFFR